MLEGIRGGIGLLGDISIGLPVFGVIALGVVAFLVWRRTHSTYPMMTRLWRLFIGSGKSKDPVISQFLDEQASLMEFRFTTGAKVRTQKLAHQLIDWTRRHNEDIGDVAACGPYFDYERVMLKKEDELPKLWQIIAGVVSALVLLLITTVLAIGIVWSDAGMQMKKSRVFFTLSAESAKPWWSEPGLSKAQCLSGEALPATGFSEDDAKIVCKIFKDENLTAFLQKTIMQQRIAFGFGTLVFMWYFWGAFSWLMCGHKARTMFKRLDNKEKQAPQTLIEPDQPEAV